MLVLLVCRPVRLYSVKQETLKEWVKEKWLAKGSRKGQREKRKIRRWLLF